MRFCVFLFQKEYQPFNNITQLCFPSKIGKKRRQLGLKQAELAKLAGVSQSLIAKLEAGTIDSSYTKVKTIFDVLERLRSQNTKFKNGKVVHNEVISVQKDEPILKVVKLMKEHGYSQIPVFSGKQSVGQHFGKDHFAANLGWQRFGSNL